MEAIFIIVQMLGLHVLLASASCPPGTTVGPSAKCYYVRRRHLTWFEANSSCVDMGGNLVSIHDTASHNFILQLLQTYADYGSAWIGANNFSGEWSWTDGSAFDFTVWDPDNGQPCRTLQFISLSNGPIGIGNLCQAKVDNSTASLIVIVRRHSDDVSSFNVASVRYFYDYWYTNMYPSMTQNILICEASPVSDDDKHACPGDAVVGHAKNCYHVHNRESTTWETARLYCVTTGGTLATVHSEEENELIADIISGIDSPKFWIGATYIGLFDLGWSWVDHTSFNYSNFDSVAPTPCSGQLACNAYISGSNATGDDGLAHKPGRWYIPHNQDERHDYICQFPSLSTEKPHYSPSFAVIGLSAGAMLAALAAILFVLQWRRNRKEDPDDVLPIIRSEDYTSERWDEERSFSDYQLNESSRRFLYERLDTLNSNTAPPLPLKDLELSHHHLGSGAFGSVCKAMLSTSTGIMDVAVKLLHESNVDKYRLDMLLEIDLVHDLGSNPHILHLIGYSFVRDSPILVLEYCENGDLLSFLRRHATHSNMIQDIKDALLTGSATGRTLKLQDLFSFAWQISDGMTFLASKGYIHRDLAARNVLITSHMSAKIADFGLCRRLHEEIYTMQRRTKLPVKWTAPEALSKRQFSEKSDVWSFGVLLYEIFSGGKAPFENVFPTDVLRHLDEGHRMEQPDFCSADVYRQMLDCWQANPSDRPTFDEIRRYFSASLEYLAAGYGYIRWNREVETS